MQRKNGIFHKIAHFAENKGFYIVLGLCVVAIGVSGYVLFFTGKNEQPIELPPQEVSHGQTVEEPAELPVPALPAEPEPEPKPAADTPAVPVEEQPLTQEPEPTVSVSRPVKARTPDFSRPVDGALQRACSLEELTYDETMGDWRTHGGADYLCTEGDEVRAIADGTVVAVFSDPMMGNCVTLNHGDGLKSVYCGLQTNTTLRAGIELGRGDAVGTAGGPLLAESAQDCHLHLEVLRDDEPLDPETLFD